MPEYRFYLTRIFFLSGFSFTDTDKTQDGRGRQETIFYSTLSLPPAHEHSDIYLQLCNFRTTCIYQTATRWDLPSYRITIWLIDNVTLVFVCSLDYLILCLILIRETGGLELASTITLVLQAKRENAGHRKPVFWHILRIVFIAHYEQLPKIVKRMTKYAQSNQLFSTKIILPKNGKIMEKVLGEKEPN